MLLLLYSKPRLKNVIFRYQYSKIYIELPPFDCTMYRETDELGIDRKTDR